MRLIALLFILFTGVWAAAAPMCNRVFIDLVGNIPSLEDLNLKDPEIEAKFLIPSRAAYENLKSLEGQEITLFDVNGKPVVYVVEKNKEHIYEDTNFDTKDLALFQRRGMLRQRVRHDLKNGKYKFNKAVFQAKDGPAENQGMQSAVYARNEVRGEEYGSLKKFMNKMKDLLKGKIDDLAVQFARDYSQSDRKFKEVLYIKDVRYFLKLSPKEPNAEAPSFYVSLDDVTYQGLKGKKGTANRLELEAEIIDNLSLDSNDVTQKKLVLMDQLSQYLTKFFDLTPSPESKYESGIRLTVLE